MNKKIISITFFILITFGLIGLMVTIILNNSEAGEGGKLFDLFKKGEYIKTSNYHIYFPEKHDKKSFDLIFLQTVGGDESEIEGLMSHWKKVANENGWALAAQYETNNEIDTQIVMLKALQDIKKKYSIRKVFITGFSGGGYRSCYFAFQNPDIVDAIIPMGAYCSIFNTDTAPSKKFPMLSVVGEKDTWARGDDFKSIERVNIEWSKLNFKQDVIVVPGIGHRFPTQAMGEVVKWILKQ